MNPALTISPQELQAAFAGRFVVDRVIRPGAQGIVFHARRLRAVSGTAADDDAAVKLYFGNVDIERVEREVRAMQRLRHQCLAGLLEHGRVPLRGTEFRYVAWEFLPGTALDQMLAIGQVPLRSLAVVGRDVASAISALWRERIVHRDIKPSNIILRDGDSAAVLIDLGVARHLTEPSLTAYGQTWGTIGYMSPEQSRIERQLTCKSDVFALGIVLLEIATGTHPTGRDQRVLATSQLRASAVAPLLPAGLADVIDRAIRFRPAHRTDPEAFSIEMDGWVQTL